MSRHLGLDVGGTNLKWAVVERDREPRLLKTGRLPTDTAGGEQSVVRQLLVVARTVFSDIEGIESVGVGMPGVLDPDAGVTRFIPNIPGDWDGVHVTHAMTDAIGHPVRLINDARAFTLAEHGLGAGRGATSMLGITLGTGVGGGLILDGHLYFGHEGTAGEFGHQTILPDGPRCNCGNHGCLEALARADAIAAACGQPGVEEAVAAARSGDHRAQQGLRDAGRYLGIGASNVIVLLSVDRVVIGGGVAAAGDMLLDPIQQELERRVHVTDVSRIKVVCGELGIWAGAIGAALHGSSPVPSHAPLPDPTGQAR
ncbi:MAG: ROK family protein [Chloroflexi bacterium]|nr:MAG: ROK family protein [Chloroflexota bacterium]